MKEYNTYVKEYTKKKENRQTVSADEMRLQQLTKKYLEEQHQNKLILLRRTGEQVVYGEEIMLIHYDSQSLVQASKTCAEFDKSSNLL